MKFDETVAMPCQSAKTFIEFFSEKVPITNRNRANYERELKFNELITIYESEKSKTEKLVAFTEVFESSDKLRIALRKIARYQDDERIQSHYDKLDRIACFIEDAEDKGLVEYSKRLIAHQNYMDNLPKAIHYMEQYLHSDKIFRKDILKDIGLTEATFNFFEEIIEKYVPVLKTYYEEKNAADSRERRYRTRRGVNDIYNGIVTGKTRYGDEFTPLECFMLLPFKNTENLDEILADFNIKKGSNVDIKMKNLFKGLVPDKADTIIKYFIQNKIFLNHAVPMTEKDIRDTRMIVKDREVTDEDKENIIKFMNYHEIPYTPRAFNLVRDRQLAGELYPKTKEKIKTL